MARVIQRISGNGMAIAGNRHHGWLVFLAVEVTDQAADIAKERRGSSTFSHHCGYFGNAKINGDMPGEQSRINPEGDVLRHTVRSMIGNHQYPAKARSANDAIGDVGHLPMR
jgi:hypothetical protein